MKEIADELNVTKMTVYNNAKKANVKFQKIDNVNYLTSEDEIIVINRIRKNQNKNDDFESEKKEEPNNDNLVKDETIKQLYNQIDIYKEQSNRDKEQINTLNRLLENQQVLALESNKKIKKLEDQLEEERRLNYSFDTSVNERQNVNVQEATFTGESKDTDQQQEWEQPTEVQHKDIPEEKENENLNEEPSTIDDKQFEEIDNEYEDKEEKPPKKGFWSRLFGN
jgi:partitioning protein